MTALAYAELLDVMEDLSDLIQRWMTRTGQNQTKLAALAKVSEKSISRWVNREGVPKPANRPALREALGVEHEVFEGAVEVARAALASAKQPAHLVAVEPDEPPERRYVTHLDQVSEWQLQMALGTPDVELSALLLILPILFARPNGEVFVTEDGFADAAKWDLDRVIGIWGKVLKSPYIEVEPGQRWIFKLKFVDESEGGD